MNGGPLAALYCAAQLSQRIAHCIDGDEIDAYNSFLPKQLQLATMAFTSMD